MPMIQVNILSGYSDETKRRMCEELTKTVSGVVGADPEGITVWIHEVGSSAYTRAGRSRQPGTAPQRHPCELVRDYLEAMEGRNLDKARGFLNESFIMTFPGGAQFTDLEALVEWSKDRYRFAKKTIHDLSAAYESDRIVVTCHGDLAGEWTDGKPFERVRFMDRFEVKSGKLLRQDVWNDLASARQ